MSDITERAARIKSAASLAAVIGERVKLQRTGKLWTACCPFHGEKTPSFYVYDDHYHCFGCGAHGDVFNWMMRMHRMTFTQAVDHLDAGHASVPRAVPPMKHQVPADEDTRRRVELARRIWCDAIDARSSIVEAYLRHRCVALPDEPVIRFHPRCPRKDGALPAMVALMTDPATGAPCGIHRTFLQPDGGGKATVDKPKAMLGRAGVIRLAAPLGGGLGLAEGIETALSAMQVIGWGPTWAAGTRGMIERFPVLPHITLNVFADSDDVGMTAARTCAERWAAAGQDALIHAPPAGEDWNDVAQRLAV